jgi:aminoglycoside phosphotransferase (APT) family kinase protein
MSRAPNSREELRPVAAAVPQDWASLAKYLARFGVAFGPGPPRQFAGGFGNLNYLVEINGKPAVLRRPPPGPLPPGANDMAREHRILSSLWQAYPLAPRALYFCADASVLGAPFQIIEYRDGIVIRERLPLEFGGRPEIGSTLSERLVASLVALHSVDPAKVGLDTLGRPTGFLTRTIEGWTTRGTALEDLVNPLTFRETVSWLRSRVPPEAAPALIHNDFKLDNMILDKGTLAPVAVIDWDMGTRGDPFWDVAVLLSYWAEPDDPDCIHRMRQMPTAELGFWRRHEVLAEYQRRSGRSVADFTFYRVLSLFRSAIVFLQLFHRYRRSPGADPRCAEFGTLGRELLDYAFDAAQGRVA